MRNTLYVVLFLILCFTFTACNERDQTFINETCSPMEMEEESVEQIEPFTVRNIPLPSETFNSAKVGYLMLSFEVTANEDLLLDGFVFDFFNLALPDTKVYVNYSVGNSTFGNPFARPDGTMKVYSSIFTTFLLKKGQTMTCNVNVEVTSFTSDSFCRMTLERLVGYRRVDPNKSPLEELTEKTEGAIFRGPPPAP